MRPAAIGILLSILTIGVLAQERFVRPIDEAKLDPSFHSFRTRVIEAAETHDAKFILSILDPKIELSFGGDSGIQDFKKIWGIEKPGSKFWEEFLPVIKNGGSFFRNGRQRTNTFFAPYTFNSFPADLDSFEHSVIFGSNVNLRERADPTSKVIATLSYNIVQVENDENEAGAETDMPEWYRVKTLGGLRGYVKAEYVRSPIAYRAGFEKKRGVWKMIAFISGD
jgi:hypothetical protein